MIWILVWKIWGNVVYGDNKDTIFKKNWSKLEICKFNDGCPKNFNS